MSTKFDLQVAVRASLNKGTNVAIFDEFLYQIEKPSLPGLTQVQDLGKVRKRENKKTKGDAWELFCKEYLSKILDIYEDVWLWKEMPKDIKKYLGLRRKEDNGIDIIAKVKNEDNYHAVQCKYRHHNKTNKPPVLKLAELSTFFAMCSRSGVPNEQDDRDKKRIWDAQIIMTTCRDVTKKITRYGCDIVYKYEDFSGLERVDWLKLAGDYVEHVLGNALPPSETTKDVEEDRDEDTESPRDGRSAASAAAATTSTYVVSTPDDLRRARLLRFGQL